MKFIIAIFLLASNFYCRSQNLDQVKIYVSQLSDSNFYGRGYVANGSNLAAEYILEKYKEIGLDFPLSGPFQNFKISVNTYSQSQSLTFYNRELKPGFDFIVNPQTGMSRGKFKVELLDSTHFQAPIEIDLKKKIPLIDSKGIDTPEEVSLLYEFKRQVLKENPVVQIEEKLTWSVGQQTNENAEVLIKRDAIEQIPKKLQIHIENEMVEVDLKNVIGFVPGKSQDSILIFSAHYDHLGMLGSAMFPGASDNASGTAMLLDLASFYKDKKPKYDTYFIAFAAEEAGLIGSKYFVDNPLFPLEKIKFLINLDLMGSAADGIAVVNGKLHPGETKKLSAINSEHNYVDRIKVRGKAANSDHYWFGEKGVPCFFIYTMGNAKAYHDVYDTPNGLDWAKYDEVFTLITQFVSHL